ncbi:aldo/keto reductase [Dyella caseinilytica]|uniref:Aldo/keto reductase n=1 Tax=Dyella caseinilytica TaxID=1849581 RepID=A0ABX7GR63_9GAMM|nr:aldo/keto reductase [Dyella caseinilytica]QRN52302.1 aldo/keto reductase [Dyella caseinilytica]GGA14692.1 oxidoreductase [Dyella caseinilytica]
MFELSPIVAGLWRIVDWKLDVQERVHWIEQALELGITSFDHADIYGDYRAESLFGEALKTASALRQRMQLITKCGIRLRSAQRPYRINYYDTSASYVRAEVEQSLRNLHTEQLDLVLIHRPDYLMDAAALADTFATLTREGKVAHWGVSNHTTSQFALLHQHCPLQTNQVELSPLQMDALDDGTLDQAQQLGLRPMIWSPLAGGRLFSGDDEQAHRVRAEMSTIAARYGISLTTLAFAWVLRHPSRPYPITGTGRLEGLRDAVAARDVQLDAEDWYALWTASKGHGVP